MNKTQRNPAQVEFELLEEGSFRKNTQIWAPEKSVLTASADVLTREPKGQSEQNRCLL